MNGGAPNLRRSLALAACASALALVVAPPVLADNFDSPEWQCYPFTIEPTVRSVACPEGATDDVGAPPEPATETQARPAPRASHRPRRRAARRCTAKGRHARARSHSHRARRCGRHHRHPRHHRR
jgi:hypothetical protein